MNDVVKTLKERRSIRKYTDKQITEEELNIILECGIYAPSGKNKQSGLIVVIQDKELISKIAKINASFVNKEGLNPFYDAPTLVIVFADKNISTYREDGCAIISNMINAAYSIGVSSCWIHRAKETFETEEGKKMMESWGIDSKYEAIGNCVLGYADCDLPKPFPRKDNYVIRV